MTDSASPVSEVEDIAPPVRRVLLFGSVGQLSSYLACVAVVLLPALLLMDPDPQLALVVTFGALAGSLPSVLAALPARVTVRLEAPARTGFLEQVDAVIRRMGYRMQREEEHRRYVHCLNWWARWRENEFVVKLHPEQIVITGPRHSLRSVRRQISDWLIPASRRHS